jgi:pimeloyl-ACP methyl ester carboxylesterase
MAVFLWIAALAWCQAPEAVKFPAGSQELAYLSAPGEGAALVVLPAQPETAAEEIKNWAPIAASRKWRLVMPQFPAVADPGVKNLEAMAADLRQRYVLAKQPIYLAGGGIASAAVFYAAARAPHLWTAAIAIGGSPVPAIDSDRLFAGNTLNTPVGWALTAEERSASAAIRQRLTTAGYNLTVLEAPTIGQVLDFLARHSYTAFPPKIDCETGNPTLAQCYWAKLTAFNPALRNDAIRSSRVNPDLPASLDFGGFGYQVTAPGPGVVIEWLPPDYKGPLMLKDRIVALSGKPIADPRHYVELMREVKEERPVSVTIERVTGKEKERLRLTTHYRLRQREEVVTARVQAEWVPEAREIVIVSRAVAAIELTIPEGWAPSTVNWNGNPVASPQNPGRIMVSLAGSTR